MCWVPSLASAQSIDVVELTVDQIQAAYSDGEYTAVQLTQAFLDRIEQYEEHYNAFISMNPDALFTAAELDRRYAASGPVGPLHGVPVVIKDNIDQARRVTTAGFDGFSSATACRRPVRSSSARRTCPTSRGTGRELKAQSRGRR